jgi:uncharacterized protein (DUF4415 family)
MSKKDISAKSPAEAEAAPRAAFEGDVPELGPDFFRSAQIRVGDRIVRPAATTLTGKPAKRRGRPPLGDAAKVQQSLRLSPEVLAYFRATGAGWQARIDEVLLRHVRGAQREVRRVAEGRADFRGE